MAPSGQISPAARDPQRYSIGSASTYQRRLSAAPMRERGRSFSEIAAKQSTATPPDPKTTAPAGQTAKPFTLWEKEAFGFRDFIDIVNPLQHVPIVATLYRRFTEDNIGAAPRVIGGALWGRLGGLAGGLINAVTHWFTGKDVGDHIYAALFEKRDANAATVLARDSRAPAASPVTVTSRSASVLPARQLSDRITPRSVADAQPLNRSKTGPAFTALPPPVRVPPSQTIRDSYLPEEKRWDIEDGDDRRVKFTV